MEYCTVKMALDLGTKTGFCIFSDDGKILESGTVNFAQRRGSHLGLRFVRFADWLENKFKQYNITLIAYEAVYAHTGIEAAHVYGGLLYAMASVACRHGVDLAPLGVMTIKKVATGNGHAGKQEVIDAVRMFGCNPIDDNEADAIAVMVTFQQVKGRN